MDSIQTKKTASNRPAFNTTVKGGLISNLFEEQVKRQPDSTVLASDHRQITYNMLNRKVNRLAHHLRRRFGIVPGTVVAVMQQKTEGSLIAFLAAAKTGGVFLPIDPNEPEARARHMIRESSAQVLIGKLGSIRNFRSDVLLLPNLATPFLPDNNQQSAGTPNDWACIHYNRHHTGQLVGVIHSQKTILEIAHDRIKSLGQNGSTWVLVSSSPHRMNWLVEVVSTLICGGLLITNLGAPLVRIPLPICCETPSNQANDQIELARGYPAIGYMNRPDLTAAEFLPAEFGGRKHHPLVSNDGLLPPGQDQAIQHA